MTNLSRQERAGVCQALQHMRKTGNAAAGSPLDAANMSSLSTTESHRTEAPEERGLTSINWPMADLLKPRALSTSRDRASNAEQPRSERTAAPIPMKLRYEALEPLTGLGRKPACTNRLPATMRADLK